MGIFLEENSSKMFSLSAGDLVLGLFFKKPTLPPADNSVIPLVPLSQTIHTASMHLKCVSGVLYYVSFY